MRKSNFDDNKVNSSILLPFLLLKHPETNSVRKRWQITKLHKQREMLQLETKPMELGCKYVLNVISYKN